jgi:hypothetical protein
MAYKKKLLVLSVITGVLALGYTAALLFNPDRVGARRSLYLWLDPKWLDQVDRLDLRGDEDITLIRRGDGWFAVMGDAEVPAKQSRVEDLLRVLSTRGAYPSRGSSPSSHERLGLTEDAAFRVVVRAGAGVPLLDLLIGNRDAAGQVYLRKNGQDEARSGEDLLGSYIAGSRGSWYNLKLLDGAGAPALVQRISVTAPGRASLVFTRSGQGWTMEDASGEIPPGTVPDGPLVDSYIRGVLEAEGDDFTAALDARDPVFTEGGIVMEMGNGSIHAIRLGPVVEGPGTQTRRSAVVTGSGHVYALADWTVNRLFREPAYFTSASGG